jgi:hypothetical protein
MTILWMTDFRQGDLGAITKHMQTKQVSERTFLHQINQCQFAQNDISIKYFNWIWTVLDRSGMYY